MTTASAELLLAVVGAVAGSFVGTVGLRAARGEQALAGRSRCDGCERTLGWFETAPLAAYAAGGGRCRTCRAAIHPLHPLSEAAGAAAGAALGLATPWPAALLLTIMAAALLAASLVDWRFQRLPDALTLLVAVCAALLALRRGPQALASGALAATLAVLLLAVVRGIFRRLRGDPSLGLGDVKLIGALALWLGLRTAEMVAAAAVLALIVQLISPSRRGRLAFGPMLALSGWTLGLLCEVGSWPR